MELTRQEVHSATLIPLSKIDFYVRTGIACPSKPGTQGVAGLWDDRALAVLVFADRLSQSGTSLKTTRKWTDRFRAELNATDGRFEDATKALAQKYGDIAAIRDPLNKCVLFVMDQKYMQDIEEGEQEIQKVIGSRAAVLISKRLADLAFAVRDAESRIHETLFGIPTPLASYPPVKTQVKVKAQRTSKVTRVRLPGQNGRAPRPSSKRARGSRRSASKASVSSGDDGPAGGDDPPLVDSPTSQVPSHDLPPADAIDWPCIAFDGLDWNLGVGRYVGGRLHTLHPEVRA